MAAAHISLGMTHATTSWRAQDELDLCSDFPFPYSNPGPSSLHPYASAPSASSLPPFSRNLYTGQAPAKRPRAGGEYSGQLYQPQYYRGSTPGAHPPPFDNPHQSGGAGLVASFMAAQRENQTF